jgi:hypothetical protein
MVLTCSGEVARGPFSVKFNDEVTALQVNSRSLLWVLLAEEFRETRLFKLVDALEVEPLRAAGYDE